MDRFLGIKNKKKKDPADDIGNSLKKLEEEILHRKKYFPRWKPDDYLWKFNDIFTQSSELPKETQKKLGPCFRKIYDKYFKEQPEQHKLLSLPNQLVCKTNDDSEAAHNSNNPAEVSCPKFGSLPGSHGYQIGNEAFEYSSRSLRNEKNDGGSNQIKKEREETDAEIGANCKREVEKNRHTNANHTINNEKELYKQNQHAKSRIRVVDPLEEAFIFLNELVKHISCVKDIATLRESYDTFNNYYREKLSQEDKSILSKHFDKVYNDHFQALFPPKQSTESNEILSNTSLCLENQMLPESQGRTQSEVSRHSSRSIATQTVENKDGRDDSNKRQSECVFEVPIHKESSGNCTITSSNTDQIASAQSEQHQTAVAHNSIRQGRVSNEDFKLKEQEVRSFLNRLQHQVTNIQSTEMLQYYYDQFDDYYSNCLSEQDKENFYRLFSVFYSNNFQSTNVCDEGRKNQVDHDESSRIKANCRGKIALVHHCSQMENAIQVGRHTSKSHDQTHRGNSSDYADSARCLNHEEEWFVRGDNTATNSRDYSRHSRTHADTSNFHTIQANNFVGSEMGRNVVHNYSGYNHHPFRPYVDYEPDNNDHLYGNRMKTEPVPEPVPEPKPEIKIQDIHHHFADDFNPDKLDIPRDTVEFIEAVEKEADKFVEPIANFSDTNYSIAYFVIDEKLMRLLEHLDKIVCLDKKELLEKKIQVIHKIKDLHGQLDSRATD